MGSVKKFGEKLKLIASRVRSAPRWVDIKVFGLKRARTRRVRSNTRNWRHSKKKI